MKVTSGFQYRRTATLPSARGIADRSIELAKMQRDDAGLRRRHLPRRELAARRLDSGDDRAIVADRHFRRNLAVIGAGAIADRIEHDLIGADVQHRADRHRGDRLGAEAGRGEAEQRDAEAEMGEGAAPER